MYLILGRPNEQFLETTIGNGYKVSNHSPIGDGGVALYSKN